MPCHRNPNVGPTIPGPFVNWAQNITENPKRLFRPSSIDELVAIVKKAEEQERTVHAVGSGWSFNGNMLSPDFMVDTSPLNVTLSETLSEGPRNEYLKDPVFRSLTANARRRKLYHVQAGIEIRDLYQRLEEIPSGVSFNDGPGGTPRRHGYALPTLGGSGGQSIFGAISTSTHGCDTRNPGSDTLIRPLPDMVQALHLVGAGGVEYFIQRAGDQSIVDPAKLAEFMPCVSGPGEIITDDDVLNSVVVSCGRMGIVYSVVLEVVDQYFLKEIVTVDRWDNVKTKIPALRAKNRALQIVICPYPSAEQMSVGNNTTASTPFVTADGWVYFQGTDNTLWKVFNDGSQQTQINNNTTASTPFVTADGWVYFRGTDNRLWKVFKDGSKQSQINNNTTSSTPFVTADGWVYFQGTDNKLWKVFNDGTQQSQIGNNTTSSTPFVTSDGWVYFQGTDNKLWKVFNDGTQQTQINNNTTASTPFVTADGWVYFRGTDNKLWKIFNDGTRQSQIGNNTTASTPFATSDGWVYFQGTDNRLWKVFNDGSRQTQVGDNTTASTPFVTADGWVYFQGTDNTLWKIYTPLLDQTMINNNTTASTPFVTADGWVYFQGTDNKLWKVFNDGSQQAQINNNTTASTPFVTADGWVYFQGTDNTLWKVFNDGSQQAQINNNTTASTPFVTADGWVYFQGTDNTLWKVFNDGSQQTQINNNTTASTPFVTTDGWVYFRGTDNKLWKVFNDGSQQTQINNNTTASTPFVTADGWVYFRGTDNKLWKVFNDGSQQSQIGNNTTASTPFVTPDGWVYFQGTDNTLWRVFKDGTQQLQVGNNTTASTPFVGPGGWVYFRGTDNTLWKSLITQDHACTVKTRNITMPCGPGNASGTNAFDWACEQPPIVVSALVMSIITGLIAVATTSAGLLSLIPFVGPILAGMDIAAATAVIALLVPLLNPWTTIGDYLAALENVMSEFGLFSLASSIVNQIMLAFQPAGQTIDISYKVMDTTDYSANCYKALSVEVAFDADQDTYLDYVESVLEMIQEFAAQQILVGAYVSLRFCGGSQALLAIEQWPHTVCIEISALGGLDHDMQVLTAFESKAASLNAAIHWGQLNFRDREDIQRRFPRIEIWRRTLAILNAHGSINTFDNAFCKQKGLEA